MIDQGLRNFNKFYLFKLKALVLAFIFIFCFEGGAGPCEETFNSSTRYQPTKTPSEYSVRSSVWKISTQENTGTGFFIAPNKLITNFHVISSMLRTASKIEDIILSQEGSFRILKLKGILAVSALHDLALLETTQSVVHYLPIRKKPLQAQEDVFFTGYPSGQLVDVRKTSDSIIFSKDDISFFVNNSSLGGASGSPVVDAKKQVVGVLHASRINLVYSVNLNDIQVFVQGGFGNKPRNNPKRVLQKEVKNLKKLAKRGNAIAQLALGLMYSFGRREVPQNNEKAADLLKQAAEQENAEAQFHLGTIYYEGMGVPQNNEKALYWYEQAAEQGYVMAQHYLGIKYDQGRGVPQNNEKAFYWYKQAAEQGYTEAQYYLGLMYYEGEGVPQNNKKAFYWHERAAEQGYADAQYYLGLMYYEGVGVPQNNEKALYWYEQTAEQGNVMAQYIVSLGYKGGQGVPQNNEKATYWYKKALKQGDVEAQAWFIDVIKKTAEQGDVEAQAWLNDVIKVQENTEALARLQRSIM